MAENQLAGEQETPAEETPPSIEPEEEPVAEEPQVTEPEQPTDAEPQVETEEQLQTRLAELRQQREDAEREARYWAQQKRQQRDEFFKEKSRPPAPEAEITPAQAENAPKEDDFDDFDQFQKAYRKWEIDQAILQYDRKIRADQQRQQIDTFAQDLVADGIKKYADFNQVATADGNPTLPITPAMIEAFREFESPADIAYYLGKNPVECQAISRMSPVQMARALTKIEAKVQSAHAAAPSQAKKITNAPAPIKPTGPGNVVTKDPEKMSLHEYEEWRLSGGGR